MMIDITAPIREVHGCMLSDSNKPAIVYETKNGMIGISPNSEVRNLNADEADYLADKLRHLAARLRERS